GCAPSGSFTGQPVAPSLCEGGTTTVVYNVSDKCYSGSVTRTFTITVAPALIVNSPDSAVVSSCDYTDQAALDAVFATWLSQFNVSGGCAPVGNYGSPIAPPLCSGGTTTVTYVVNDLCSSPEVTESFTVIPAQKLEINCPADRTVACGEDANFIFNEWRNSFGYTGGCANATVTDLSQLQLPEPGVPLVVTFTVTDNCQVVSCTARFMVAPCANCTYTQGYYGNVNGAACTPEGETSNAKTIMMNAVNSVGGTVNFGSTVTGNYFTLTIDNITSNNIFKMLPGGGTPRALVGFATYDDYSTWSDSNPLSTNRAKRGGINNVLLSQTMTLFFNMQLNGEDLADFNLSSTFVTADTQTCGSSVPVAGTEQLFTIPQAVINYLNANGGANVGNLLVLANRALGGESIGGLTPSQVNQAVDAINRGFDECRVFVGTSMPSTERQEDVKTIASVEAGMGVRIYPNPYSENFNVVLTNAKTTKVTIAIYDMVGRLIETREVNPAETSEIKIGERYPSGVYNVVVGQGDEVKTLKVIKR
ncbi:T9SS type A sorting domain-containing protein, partial [Flavobacterium sedimenticola]